MLTSISLAFRTILRNRLRSLLTILGILIGVASLIAVTGVARGVTNRITGSLKPLAGNTLTVHSELSTALNTVGMRPLTEADAHAIATEARAVLHVAPYLTAVVSASAVERSESTTAIGTTLPYFEIRQLKFARGAAWTREQEVRSERVCVLGSYVATQLFGKTNPVHKNVRIGQFPCSIAGVLAPQGAGSIGANPDSVVVMPIGSFRGRVRPTTPGRADKILVSTRSESTDRAKKDILALMRQRHRVRPGSTPDFAVTGVGEVQQLQLAISSALSLLLLTVALVSLLVGGIGVMNIMLVSVAERTHEIGIRLSVGARSNDILMQFLVEAVVLSMIGGTLGVLLGWPASIGFGSLLKADTTPSPFAAPGAAAISGLIGVVFGFLPARHAAALDPVAALTAD